MNDPKHDAARHGTESTRLAEDCEVCGEGIDVPNKGMGRAILAAWRTQHQHREATR